MTARSRIAVLIVALIAGILALAGRHAGAEHFDILLRVSSGDKQAQASMDTTPPIGGFNPRPVLKVKPGDPIKIAWNVKNSSPHGALKNVSLHFFIVRQANTGQKPVPDAAGLAGVFDSSFTTDMAIGAVSSGALKLKLSDPGSYLIRLQSEGTHEDAGHEHFSAIDVEVH